MAGLLPINARFLPEPAAPERAEVTFGLGCWLADLTMGAIGLLLIWRLLRR